MSDLPDNPAWHTLAAEHLPFTVGNECARRYTPEYTPLMAFADPARADLEPLAEHTSLCEVLWGDGWRGPVPPAWELIDEAPVIRLAWRAGLPDPPATQHWRRLGPGDAEQALALAQATQPGPFGPRTTELGEYLGIFDGPRLVAMAGERMKAGPWREISGVCTKPEHEGRGYASALTRALVRRQKLRGERPFLHVAADNRRAWALYRRLGFAPCGETVVRAIRSRVAPTGGVRT